MTSRSPGARLSLYAAVGALARAGNAGLPSAIILGVLAAGGIASQGSLLVAALTAVAGIIGPLVGAVVDRTEHPRRAFLVAVAVLALCSAALAVGIGEWTAAALILVAMLAGLAHPLFTGAWSAQLRRIVPDLPPARSYAVDVGTYNAGDIAGPALVGFAYVFDAAVPGASSMEVVVILYICAAVVLPFVPIPARSHTHEVEPPPFAHMVRGLSVFWHSVGLRRSTVISTIGYCAVAGLVLAAPLLGTDLAGNAGTGALLLAVTAGGALCGSIVMARRPLQRWGPGRVVVFTTFGVGVCFALLAAVPTMALAIPIAILIGFFEAPQLSSVLLIRDREAPKDVRSLVFVAATSLKTAAFSAGSIIAALLAPHGWRVVLMGSGCLAFLAVIAGLLIGAAPGRQVVDDKELDKGTMAP